MIKIWNCLKWYIIAVCGIAALISCTNMSELESDPTAGLNGGFEITKNGLPVNWVMYTSNTVPKGDFEILMDETTFKEGKQSLKFEVVECSSMSGWHSPGFTNEFFERGRGTYRLSFWYKNHGATFRVQAGGVTPFEGEMKRVIESSATTKDWKYVEHEVHVSEEAHLRIELNVVQPGTFWIDDVQIVQL